MHTLSSLEIKKEIAGSKLLLEKKLGLPIHWFAYPFGDYNKEAVKWVKQAGYKAAFSTEQGENFPFSIPRKSIGGINIRGKKFGACLQHAIRLSSL
jgi:peptidoglycan/xylan/chitin deacetylase (PgdA/CDA1 family)